jgi:hypothetical protein
MKILVMATIAALAMGSLFHEDIVRTLSADGTRTQASIPAVKSVGNLGSSMNDNMQGIGASLAR